MRNFVKSLSIGLVLSLAVSAQSIAQDSGPRYFGPESLALANEAKSFQAANEHKSAIKKLKKALKLKGLSAYETSAIEQMLGASYYASGKTDKAIESFEDAVAAGGLRENEARGLRVNIAQLNIADKNYALGAQQLERYFREGGPQKASLVKSVMSAHMRAGNRPAAVPWADKVLQNGFAKTRLEYDTLVYIFDSPEKRADQIRVVERMLTMWPGDAELAAKLAGLKRKAEYEASTSG